MDHAHVSKEKQACKGIKQINFASEIDPAVISVTDRSFTCRSHHKYGSVVTGRTLFITRGRFLAGGDPGEDEDSILTLVAGNSPLAAAATSFDSTVADGNCFEDEEDS